MRRCARTAWLFIFLSAAALSRAQGGSHVTINEDMVLVIGGKKVFPIGFTMPPPPDALAPNGKDGIAELSDAGATFLRTGVMGKAWMAFNQTSQDAQVSRLENAGRQPKSCLCRMASMIVVVLVRLFMGPFPQTRSTLPMPSLCPVVQAVPQPYG